MKENKLRLSFLIINYILGILIAVSSIKTFCEKRVFAPLFITAAIIVGGPLEDFLMKQVKPEQQWIIDQLTSIGFLVFLLLAVLELSK